MKLRLFVVGASPRSDRAVHNLERLCRGQDVELEVVDVLEHPDVAERERIFVTPTLIRLEPLPMRRIVGDLSDARQVRVGLDLPLEEDES